MHRICSKCLDKKGKRKKSSPEGTGSGQSTSKRSKTTGGSKGASRPRLTAEELTALLAGKRIGNDSEVEGEEDEENEEEDGESTGRGRGAPPSYGELSSHFGIPERAAQDSGNADTALYEVPV